MMPEFFCAAKLVKRQSAVSQFHIWVGRLNRYTTRGVTFINMPKSMVLHKLLCTVHRVYSPWLMMLLLKITP